MTLRNSLLVVSAVFFSFVGGPAPTAHAELLEDLILYYDFEDSTFQNKAPGFSGVYLPTVTGSPTSGYAGTTPGRTQLLVGKAMNINDTAISGTTNLDQIRVTLGSGALAVLPGTNLGNAFSISVWAYLAPADLNRADRFYVFEPNNSFDISWGTTAGGTGPDNFAAYVNQSQATLNPAVSLARQTWHHVVHTFEPGVTAGNILLKVYVDGDLHGSHETGLSGFSFQHINFGNARDEANRAWDGLLDELAIWERTLDADEVGIVYATGRAGQSLLNPVPEPSTMTLGGIAVAWSLVMVRRRAKRS